MNNEMALTVRNLRKKYLSHVKSNQNDSDFKPETNYNRTDIRRYLTVAQRKELSRDLSKQVFGGTMMRYTYYRNLCCLWGRIGGLK